MNTKPLEKEPSKINGTNYLITLLLVYMFMGVMAYAYVATHRTDVEVCK